MYVFVFFKQKTAYEMRISDWSSDVCSSDLRGVAEVRKSAIHRGLQGTRRAQRAPPPRRRSEIARRDRRVGGQSCAGPRLSRQAARRSGDDRDAEDDAAGEGIADREPRGRDRAVRREIRRCLGACAATRKGTRADLRPPLRPSAYRGEIGEGPRGP